MSSLITMKGLNQSRVIIELNSVDIKIDHNGIFEDVSTPLCTGKVILL